VPTPPEIAAAFNVAPELTQVSAGMSDWETWRDAHAPWSGPPGRVSPMFYTSGTTGRPKGVLRGQMRPEQLALAERVSTLAYGIRPDDNQVVLMNGPYTGHRRQVSDVAIDHAE
jgi:long-chain acyl-CoA synthetase